MHFVDALLSNDLNNGIFLWDVSVTDSFEDVLSNNGPFSLFIDIHEILNTSENNIIPDIYTLYQNYPNPFNPITTIKYDLPEDQFVSITIYDVMGRNIRTLMNMNQNAGYHSVRWDAKNNIGEQVATGMYIYTIKAGDFLSSKKIVLLK